MLVKAQKAHVPDLEKRPETFDPIDTRMPVSELLVAAFYLEKFLVSLIPPEHRSRPASQNE